MVEVADRSAYTKVGTSHGNCNQDSYVLERDHIPSIGNVTVAAVFDGHSPGGEFAARTAAQWLRRSFFAACQSASDQHLTLWQQLVDQPEHSMRTMFHSMHSNILDESYKAVPDTYIYVSGPGTMTYHCKPDDRYGQIFELHGHKPAPVDFGCTASVVVVLESLGQLIAANAGDSPIVLARQKTDDPHAELDLQSLVKAHNIRSQAERDRIAQSVGKRAAFTADFYLAAADDPALAQHQVQTSRSLGHKHLSHYGIVPDPEIRVMRLDDSGVAVCVLSDGITNSMPKGAILDILAHAHDASEVSSRLVRQAHEKSVQIHHDSDDCTAVVVYI